MGLLLGYQPRMAADCVQRGYSTPIVRPATGWRQPWMHFRFGYLQNCLAEYIFCLYIYMHTCYSDWAELCDIILISILNCQATRTAACWFVYIVSIKLLKSVRVELSLVITFKISYTIGLACLLAIVTSWADLCMLKLCLHTVFCWVAKKYCWLLFAHLLVTEMINTIDHHSSREVIFTKAFGLFE